VGSVKTKLAQLVIVATVSFLLLCQSNGLVQANPVGLLYPHDPHTFTNILSPKHNQTYNATGVPLIFSLDMSKWNEYSREYNPDYSFSVASIEYYLDNGLAGQIVGNRTGNGTLTVTLNNLSLGAHTVSVKTSTVGLHWTVVGHDNQGHSEWDESSAPTLDVSSTINFTVNAPLTTLTPPTSSVSNATSKTIAVPTDYLTIQTAIDHASEGDTIYVKTGTYVENPVINKSISLIGEDRDVTVIDVTAGLKVESNKVTITGFTIYDGWRGISLSANNCNISGNKITNSTNGIVLFGCENNNITENIFQSIGPSSAIQLNFANGNLVKNNYIDSCVEGIQIWQSSSNNTVTENTIKNCQDVAVNFQYSNENTIIGNNISRAGLGTSIYGSNKNTITKNNYFYNTVQFGASETYYLTFGYNRSVNIIYGNYWSNYNGTDANWDGIGDTPYVIDDNNKDNVPVIMPIGDLATALEPSFTPSPSPSMPSNSPTQKPESSPSPSVPEFPSWIILPLGFVALITAGFFFKDATKRTLQSFFHYAKTGSGHIWFVKLIRSESS
jgi:nitrous oxidase accessory protein